MEGDFTFAGSPSAVGPLTLTNLESLYAEYAEVESPIVSGSMFDHATTTSDHIWTLTDLQVLHELRVPVTVVVPGIVESTHRYTGAGAKKEWSVNYKQICSDCCLLAVLTACCTRRGASSRMPSFSGGLDCHFHKTYFLKRWTHSQMTHAKPGGTGSLRSCWQVARLPSGHRVVSVCKRPLYLVQLRPLPTGV